MNSMKTRGKSSGSGLVRGLLIVSTVLLSSALVSAQTGRETRTLVVSGQPGEAAVIERNGKSYVDIDALARLTNGSLSFKGTQIVLTLPGASGGAPAAAPDVGSGPANSAFSKEFLKAGADQVAVIREWRGALAEAIQNGYPATAESMSKYRAQAIKGLHLVFVAVSTGADRSAYQLVSNQLDNMQKLSNKIVAAHDDMQNITPDSFRDDPLNQQVTNCSKSLVAMGATGQFQDDGSCH
jgi:hypothetical protein